LESFSRVITQSVSEQMARLRLRREPGRDAHEKSSFMNLSCPNPVSDWGICLTFTPFLNILVLSWNEQESGMGMFHHSKSGFMSIVQRIT
jgi:hypothetical protein